ncbi:UNVERIFIED_ORG: drug/metabolite transporter (DMT)-like permease [Methylobacterium sp. SuP10 SLI 274]|uniref:DMT family transporter n=1 Tax=Methylorubrum extorquens TaxID=408 RepID=UPI00209EF065|nr:DMT family transporter [Methylorubrum extorquens]MDF9862191.1 drug/metabolite transporter (DMT)-like permease [Methylorubrum pseudosasae]MDH6635811.1 drug/metabolite transporter (DMT)-like permease [Methylobacterium sp. SuP10 SLI 274]MDH6664984.1 drug/metabolite transporter (DMT)-like permease [Methylorubrum zatmanii]MCP1556912.1 drug/metabolite transporter (DMT)-like permease [Methylorubrum extorquens]MDF9790488.1 drug/metabolite transporter (DMT)-like permease [Methylorubrum extorquens]
MPTVVNRTMSPFEWAMLLGLSVLWGGSFFFAGVALSALPPLTLVVLRVGLAALILNAALPLASLRLPRGRNVWVAFFGMGLLNNVVPFCLIVWGQTQIASGLAAILNATTPLFTVVVAHLLTSDERMTGNRLAGALTGLVGVAVMIGTAAFADEGSHLLAQIAVLGAALSYALAGVFGRRFQRMGVPPLATATGQVTASTLLLLPVTLLTDRPWTLPMPGAPVWGAVLGIAALSTALAYLLYFRLLATAGATNLLLVTFLIPVTAILLGTGVLGESLEVRHIVGMALIGVGLAAIDGRILRQVRRRRIEEPGLYQGRDI